MSVESETRPTQAKQARLLGCGVEIFDARSFASDVPNIGKWRATLRQREKQALFAV
jgi:hypothetical protein